VARTVAFRWSTPKKRVPAKGKADPLAMSIDEPTQLARQFAEAAASLRQEIVED
jgi:hypothetical protein